MSQLDPRLIPIIYSAAPSPFQQRENIDLFLAACEEYGMPRHGLFSTNDLFFGTSMASVVDSLCSLAALAHTTHTTKVLEMERRKFGAKKDDALVAVPPFTMDETIPLRKVPPSPPLPPCKLTTSHLSSSFAMSTLSLLVSLSSLPLLLSHSLFDSSLRRRSTNFLVAAKEATAFPSATK
jgi:hypothetical protein